MGHNTSRVTTVLNKLLQRQQRFASCSDQESGNKLWKGFWKAVKIIRQDDLTAEQLLLATNITVFPLISGGDQLNTEELSICRSGLMIELTEATARNMGSQATVTGIWEEIVWKIVNLTPWKPEHPDIIYRVLPKSYMKEWVIRVLCDQEMCPNSYLRLEMFHLIAMWDMEELQNAVIGEQVVSGLVNLSGYIRLGHLIPRNNQPCLTYPLYKVLKCLEKCNHLAPVVSASVLSVSNLEVGPETRCLAHLMELTEKVADEFGLVTELPDNYLLFVTNFNFLVMMLTSSPLMAAWESPGLAQIAASAIISTTSSLLPAIPSLLAVSTEGCNMVTEAVNRLFSALAGSGSLQSVCMVLRRDHSYGLSVITKLAKDYGWSTLNIPTPCQESDEGCPERLVDSITQSVMVDPVTLLSSNMEVDESTLIKLLLTSPTDPFTRCPLNHDTFKRRPDLRQEITKWKSGHVFAANGGNASVNDKDIHSDCEL